MHNLLMSHQKTLSVAESCTGGLISHMVTSIPGSSAYFRAGIVSYADDIKRDVLCLAADTISRYGVVSNETALEMAEKVCYLTKSDCSIATTGNLGPHALEEKPVGLVYVAVGIRESLRSRKLMLKGNRDENKQAAAIAAVELLNELLEERE